MRLSAILLFGKKPYGYKYRGTNRVLKAITVPQLNSLRADYERTEKNMLYLRHPYLTVEQSKGNAPLNQYQKNARFLESIMEFKNKKFAKHVTLAESLVHLKVKEAWD